MNKLLSRIAGFSKDYREKVLNDRVDRKEEFLKDPVKALEFIFSLSFYQGRRDVISEIFERRTKEVLIPYLQRQNILLKNSILVKKSELGKPPKDELPPKYKKYKKIYKLLEKNDVNKYADRLMVISIINFIQSCKEKNIVKYLIEKIESGEISTAYKELLKIYSIGPKISSFILRDTVCIYELAGNLNPEDYNYLFPVDTWVRQISKKLKIISSKSKNEAKDIVEKCIENNIDPLAFNQGVWYIGTHSLEILLNILKNES